MDSARITARLPLQTDDKEAAQGNKFGTFGGVFTPSILTILGVIMFLRSGFVVGQAGILGAVAILCIAKAITVFTSCSVSAISTNMQVRGGGAYFMISRVLGPEFGGAIGLALFFAQALSVPFYIMGFTEAVVDTFPSLRPYFLAITCATAALLLVVAFVGAGWAIRAQFVIMIVLALAIVVVLGGAAAGFSVERFVENWGPGYGPMSPAADGAPPGPQHSFWTIFAIYFPAVTGILAGVNMSGDLKDPARSIPRGTFLAVGASFLVYLALALLAGGAFSREELISGSYQALKNSALFGESRLVAAGVFAASLSSALGSYLGAPRILQAVSRDGILTWLSPFAKGSEKGDEPRRALLLTAVMTYAVLLWAGNESEGGPLNAIAAVITMFFLYTYGMTNLAAFIEAFGRNPSFRPRFRFFHWSTGLMGAAGCVGVALLIDPIAALVAALAVAGLLYYIKTRDLQTSFGDARRGFVFSSVRKNLLRLAALDEDPKNWRPTILVFSGNPASREALVSYAVWLEAGRGIVLLANILKGSVEDDEGVAETRRKAEAQLRDFCLEKRLQAFPVTAIHPNIDSSIAFLLQSTTVGPIRPNLAMFGWTHSAERAATLASHMRVAEHVGTSLVLVRDRGVPTRRGSKRIDVWWRGHENGGLMILLAHLLTRNWEWLGARVRILRVVDTEAEVPYAEAELNGLIDHARVRAEPAPVVGGGRAFKKLLYERSRDADCVILGFSIPDAQGVEGWHGAYESLLKGLPTTLLVRSVGIVDLFA